MGVLEHYYRKLWLPGEWPLKASGLGPLSQEVEVRWQVAEQQGADPDGQTVAICRNCHGPTANVKGQVCRRCE